MLVEDGLMILHAVGIKDDNVEEIQKELNKNRNYIYTKDRYGEPLWNIAAYLNNHINLEFLIEQPEVDINAPGKLQNALGIAISKGCLESIQVLINSPKINVRLPDRALETPLFIAYLAGHIDIVEGLLSLFPNLLLEESVEFEYSTLGRVLKNGSLNEDSYIIEHLILPSLSNANKNAIAYGKPLKEHINNVVSYNPELKELFAKFM